MTITFGAKSFLATSGEEEVILLPVKVIAKAKSSFPVYAGLSYCAVCRYVGRRKTAIGRVSTLLAAAHTGTAYSKCLRASDLYCCTPSCTEILSQPPKSHRLTKTGCPSWYQPTVQENQRKNQSKTGIKWDLIFS